MCGIVGYVGPREGTYPKIVSNVQEVNARGGRVLAVVTEGAGEIRHRRMTGTEKRGEA